MITNPLENIWLLLILWGLVYLADFYLTMYSARIFQGRMREHIRFEGSLELTPVFQKDVDAIRMLSPNFFIRWLASFPVLYLVGWLSINFLGLPQYFTLVMGALLLREVAVILRHIRNLGLAQLSKNGGIQGAIEYARWLSLRLSAVELVSFAGFFLILAFLESSWFFLGGALSCLLTGYQHWVYARKRIAMQQRSQEAR